MSSSLHELALKHVQVEKKEEELEGRHFVRGTSQDLPLMNQNKIDILKQ